MIVSFIYKAEVLRVVDGDTLDLEIDLGFRSFVKHRCRLHGIDTPETYGVKKDSDEFAKGMAAKDAALAWIEKHSAGEGRGPLAIRSHDGGPPRGGKYGRWIIEVFPVSVDDGRISKMPQSLNEYLVAEGHAVRKEY